APVRRVTLALLTLSLVPSAGLADPAFPVRFAGLPIPATAFAALGLAVLRGTAWPLVDVLLAIVWGGGIALAWYVLSDTYIVHGLRPTMSAGFGQVDMGSRMEIQRHLTARLGGVTTRVRFRPEQGGDTSLMTRLHLVRIWRDGSFVYIAILAVVVILSSGFGAGGGSATGAGTATALLTRIKVKPSAFSFAVLGIFFLVSLGGFMGGLAAQAAVVAARSFGVFAAEAQATVLVGFLLALTSFGLWIVTRLAASFRL